LQDTEGLAQHALIRNKAQSINMRPEIELTSEQIKLVAQLSGIGMSHTMIADFLEISRSTFDRMLGRDERVKEATLMGKAKASSKVMKTAFEMASNGRCPSMTMFWLRCQLRWSEPKEETIPEAPITVSYIPKSKRKKLNAGDGDTNI
jgi:hypothetical protein